MRCQQAVLAAFLSHPRLRTHPAIVRSAEQAGWEMARFLSPAIARAALLRDRAEVVARQAKTGFWKPPARGKREHAPSLSADILRGIHRAGLLKEIGTADLPLRYDPFPPFGERDDSHGLMVRRLYKRPADDDSALTDRLIGATLGRQQADGGWEGTVMSTALALDRLFDLGLFVDAPAITRGAHWLLAQYRENFLRRRRLLVTANSLFCSADCNAEFAAAQREIPEAIPVGACYVHLPLIPTGLALRALVTAGYAAHPRVEASFDALLAMAVPYADLHEDTGGEGVWWCAHKCYFRLENEVKAAQASGTPASRGA
jgi:hypothetical protein